MLYFLFATSAFLPLSEKQESQNNTEKKIVDLRTELVKINKGTE